MRSFCIDCASFGMNGIGGVCCSGVVFLLRLYKENAIGTSESVQMILRESVDRMLSEDVATDERGSSSPSMHMYAGCSIALASVLVL